MPSEAIPHAVSEPDQLLGWARSRAPEDRERLLNKLSDLCAFDPSQSSAAASQLLEEVLLTLAAEAERDIRRRLAARLAGQAWAPQALVTVLALDDIEIARPLIAESPVLKDADLVRLLVQATVEHQIEVARRPRIGARVVDAILTRSEPAVLSALAANDTAEVDAPAMTRMVELSRRIAAMRAPLSRHPALTEALAEQLYVWVGQSLREALSARFTLDPALLTPAIADAVREAAAAPPPARDDPEREDMERRLVAKLSISGQLGPAYLMRALREGRRSLFVQALSALSGFSPDDVRLAMTGERPELLAYACVAVGLDRGAFPALLEGVRVLSDGAPRLAPDSRRRIAAAFGLTPDLARAAFRAAMAPELPIAV